MRLRPGRFSVLFALLALSVSAQSLWVEAKVLVPLRVELPSGADPSRTYPLVLLLHGSGGTAEAMMALRDRLGPSSFLLAAPQGPYPMGNGFRWFHPSHDPKLWARTDAHSVELIQRVIEALRQRHQVGGIYLLGHSEGAGLAYLAAARLPREVAGVLAFGAGKPGDILGKVDLAALKGMPHFLAHGRQDRLIPYSDVPSRLATWKEAEVPTTFEGYFGGHDLSQAPMSAAGAWILKQEQTRLATP